MPFTANYCHAILTSVDLEKLLQNGNIEGNHYE
jgi:hypothetical protein